MRPCASAWMARCGRRVPTSRGSSTTMASPALDARGWDIVIAATLAASTAIYVVGLARLWRSAGPARGIRWLNVTAFALGIVALIVALLSPLVSLSDVLFSAHMGQHEILMLVAAPLLVMGKPWLTGAWALPGRW